MSPYRILVADDDPGVCEFLQVMLGYHGYEVDTAHDGAEALKKLREAKERDFQKEFDLLIVDVQMPQLDGFEVLEAIKESQEYRHLRQLPVIMASNNSHADFVQKAIQGGAEEYLKKPIEEAALVARVNASLKKVDLYRRLQLLTLSIFPEEIAQELLDGKRPEPTFFPSATVVFTDFVGFTTTARDFQDCPDRLIDELDTCFSKFDKIVAQHRLRRIQTVGDAYMSCGGVPVENSTHAVDAVLVALKMRRFVMKRLQTKKKPPVWEIRLGIHTGPICAAVIGEAGSPHAYDIFGDTVNVASRMESNSEPNQINISEDTRKLVEPFYELIDRGTHSVKGKEDMRMFFVAGIKPELRNQVSPDDETSTGEAFKKKYDAIKGTETSIRQGSPA